MRLVNNHYFSRMFLCRKRKQRKNSLELSNHATVTKGKAPSALGCHTHSV
jgi:hypothetical protein